MVKTEDEALYLTGLLNSAAINSVIKEFQPRGQFGERHIHKLPFGVTPAFDQTNPAHPYVVAKTKQLMADWNSYKLSNNAKARDLLNQNKSPLHIRKKKIKEILVALSYWQDYENACKAVCCIVKGLLLDAAGN